ncbi:hypothetical protein BKA93DRAFT_828633 [Sparassis latifolia]
MARTTYLSRTAIALSTLAKKGAKTASFQEILDTVEPRDNGSRSRVFDSSVRKAVTYQRKCGNVEYNKGTRVVTFTPRGIERKFECGAKARAKKRASAVKRVFDENRRLKMFMNEMQEHIRRYDILLPQASPSTGDRGNRPDEEGWAELSQKVKEIVQKLEDNDEKVYQLFDNIDEQSRYTRQIECLVTTALETAQQKQKDATAEIDKLEKDMDEFKNNKEGKIDELKAVERASGLWDGRARGEDGVAED